MQNNRIKSRLLLLDDDKKIRDILKFFLNDLGYTISEATTSQEAAVQLNRYKDECLVLIMDWKLRDEDPHAVIRALRSIRPELVVLVVSGYPPKTSSIEAMNIYRWFTKPYEKNQLDIEIQRALHKLTVAQGESPQ
jgi:DNA-binding NtrC family response regulator